MQVKSAFTLYMLQRTATITEQKRQFPKQLTNLKAYFSV